MDPTTILKPPNVLLKAALSSLAVVKVKASSSNNSKAAATIVVDGTVVAMPIAVVATLGQPTPTILAHSSSSKRSLSFCSQWRSQLDLNNTRISLSPDRMFHRSREDGTTRRNHFLRDLQMLLQVRHGYSITISMKRLLAAGVLRETVASNVSPGMAL